VPLEAQIGEFILALPMLVFAMVAHEYAHGAAALSQGDDTAWMLGRLTLNPIPHIDPWMSLILPGFLFWSTGGKFVLGGARPVPVNPRKYRNYRRGDVIVSLAGVVTNLAIALASALLFVLVGLAAGSFPGAAPVLETAQRMLTWGIWLNVLLCFFNLIPIPPLDGSHVAYHLLPARLGAAYRSISRFGILPLLAILLFFPQVLAVLLTPARYGLELLVGLIAPFQIGSALRIFG
jgi:Zn-dependent protease